MKIHYKEFIKINNDDDEIININNFDDSELCKMISENNMTMNTKIESLTSSIDNIKSFLSDHVIQAPDDVENTILNDDEICDILSYLLECQEKYFPDIPLKEDLCKSFMWNIPKSIYKTFINVRDYPKNNIYNPLLYFYIFCVDDPDSAMPLFLHRIIGMIDTKLKNEIEQKSNEYLEMFNDEN